MNSMDEFYLQRRQKSNLQYRQVITTTQMSHIFMCSMDGHSFKKSILLITNCQINIDENKMSGRLDQNPTQSKAKSRLQFSWQIEIHNTAHMIKMGSKKTNFMMSFF